MLALVVVEVRRAGQSGRETCDRVDDLRGAPDAVEPADVTTQPADLTADHAASEAGVAVVVAHRGRRPGSRAARSRGSRPRHGSRAVTVRDRDQLHRPGFRRNVSPWSRHAERVAETIVFLRATTFPGRHGRAP